MMVDGEKKHTIDVDSYRAGHVPEIARDYAEKEAHALYDGIDGVEDDVRVIRMGEPHDQFDETGGVAL